MTSPRSTAWRASATAKGLRSSARALLRHLRSLRVVFGLPSGWVVQLFKNLIPKLLSNPQVAEILRFIFLGTVVETSRLAGQKAADFVKHFFVVKASFTRGDFAFDWVKRYLEDQRVWDHSRIFQVAACSPALRHGKHTVLGGADDSDSAQDHEDGRPHPFYQPAPREPELFRWRGHWITVSMNMDSSPNYEGEGVQVLSLSVWSRNRRILDDFVQDARTHYYNSPLPPRELFMLPDDCGSLLTARFNQGDTSYDWMLAFLRERDGFEHITDLEVTTKHSDLYLPSTHPTDRSLVGYKPAPRVKQRLKWRDHWLQFDVEPTNSSFDGRSFGGSVTVTVHNSKRSVLEDLIAAAHAEYLKSTVSKVTVHLADRYGSWVKCITKSRRALNTLILPENVKEGLLKDAREFLDSEEWYVWAGVPHRRGYLLYGEPGTGKSSTIHALASELGLEIYYIQLGTQGMDDHILASLIASTPSRCILLLEDIDCAFPSREDDDDDDDGPKDAYGNPLITYQPRSEVTLSGLLNVLDSVTSEEGRITFATTNHIEKLDPALIRAGRMDVKIEYKLASRQQMYKTYTRFFEQRFVSLKDELNGNADPHKSGPSRPALNGIENPLPDEPPLSQTDVQSHAERFADAIPEYTFSLAQVQGYLLTKKTEPRAAVEHAARWVEEQLSEKMKIEELKEKKRAKRRERKAAQEAAAQAARDKAADSNNEGNGDAKEVAESDGEYDGDAKGESDQQERTDEPVTDMNAETRWKTTNGNPAISA